MKVQQFIDKIRLNPYFQELVRHCQMSEKQFFANHWNARIYPFHWKNPQDNYTQGTRYQFTIDRLRKHTPEFRRKFTLDLGAMRFTVCVYIGDEGSRYNNPAIVSRMYFTAENFIVTNEYWNEWNQLKDLDPKLDLSEKSLKSTAIQHLRKYFFLEGIAQSLQLFHCASKTSAKFFFKEYLTSKAFHKRPGIEEKTVIRSIEKRLNLKCHVCFDDFIEFARTHKRKDETVSVEYFDTDFMHDFDGDIDKALDEFYNANPITRHTVYIEHVQPRICIW